MNGITSMKHFSHSEAIDLLAWYVTDSLEADESAAVEAHVESCDTCRSELSELRLVHQSVAEVGNEEPAYRPALVDEALARIDASERPARSKPYKPSLWALATMLFAEFRDRLAWQGTPAFARIAVVGQFALLVALGTFAFDEGPAEPSYETLSGPVVATAGAKVSVAFRETATVAEVQALLRELEVEIVAGPSALGLYTVAIGAAGRAEQIVERLEASGLAQFAAPVAE